MHIHEIEIQINTHLPETPFPYPSVENITAQPHNAQRTFTQRKEVGIPYPLLTTANDADSAFVFDCKRGYGMQLAKVT